ncbi:alkene reductase [Deminuibacter soli]|uniref:Alkene reductase n=1 Tax=Deminuibacter soli TaxID=2291815 RepID=A0A3E1NR30_9BACT|nr:alkene reductase [Deminuibacter soli]RFM30274.1 alkene reductase [Deminuibacter soli]
MSSAIPFTQYKLGDILLKNRLVMAPMTRGRAIDNQPNELMAEYYTQRSSAGLIISEGIAPSPNGLGYARMPGIYSAEQIAGWKKVTQAVHAKGGKIFAQLMHCGRMSHPLNVPEGGKIVAPSAIASGTDMWTDQQGMLPAPVPEAISTAAIPLTIDEFVQAAENAITAGFDGVELHSANGYLLEQFMSPGSNHRSDAYGGSIEKRARMVLEVARAVSQRIGTGKTAIRISPFGTAGGMEVYEEIAQAYQYLAAELQQLGLVYLHITDNSSAGVPDVPLSLKQSIRKLFRNTLILSGSYGYDMERAEEDLSTGLANLIALGRPYISNPDLKERLQNNWPLAEPASASTYYAGTAKGYTDYPVYKEQPVLAY